MPLVINSAPSTVRNANVVLSRAFFPRAKQWLYPRLSSSYVSHRDVEPHAAIGAAPPLRVYNGSLSFNRIPSFTQQCPNLLFKSAFEIAQEDYEFDQQRVLLQLAAQAGVRSAELWDMLFCRRILKASSDTTVSFRGATYNLTLDGKAFFATNHSTDPGVSGGQSNIVTGTFPTTTAALVAQSPSTNANAMISDFQSVIAKFKTFTDTNGVPLFPSLDTQKSVVVVVPPGMEPIAKLAFRTPGSVVSQTTNVMSQFVADVLSHGYLAGLPDVLDESLATVSPLNQTDWYAFVLDDWVKPFYTQLFSPASDNDLFPRGYDAGAVADQIVKADNGITVDQATAFASTRIDTTFRNVGANSDYYTIKNESFIVSPRCRGNIMYGPWFLGIKIKPNGGA